MSASAAPAPRSGPVRRVKAALYAWISRRYMPGCSNYNTLAVRRASRSKRQARQMFAAHGFPHAQGRVFAGFGAARRFAQEHGYPLVVKPNVSGFSRGSHFPINDAAELTRACWWAKAWWPTSIVERYLSGANYRVLATPERIASVIQRYPPFVDGDGVSDIDTLIDAENAVRERMGLYPIMHPIAKGDAARAHLNKQGLDFSSVPAAGERVTVFHRVALAPGGVVETIDQGSIPEVNRQLFKDVVKAWDARLFGVDVIFEKGIHIDYREQKTILLEVNSRPYTRMHSAPRYGEVEDLTAFYAEMDALTVDDADTF